VADFFRHVLDAMPSRPAPLFTHTQVKSSKMEHHVRPAQPEDQEFLFRLYASTRPEVSALGWTAQQQEAFLRMQFNAQQRWYQTAYPASEHNIVLVNDEAVGRMLLSSNHDSVTLVDISLLPDYRSQGIGGALIHTLVETAKGKRQAVSLQVLKTNPAQHLYQRLGFVVTGQDELYLQMQTRVTDAPIQD
jgi:ribosomal protein S18 acetylase RimI-like enzyme